MKTQNVRGETDMGIEKSAGRDTGMFGECHVHLFMNGRNYREAVELHRHGVQEADIREKLRQYQMRGITFVRDGGDALGVSAFAKKIAPEYGITYLTPLFAIHKNGHYGGIVGYGFGSWKEYHALVKRAAAEGADFIKVMFSGIMDFAREGALTEEPLDAEEIREMIHIAHEEGMAVMAHVNGADAVRSAVEAGVDSVEHGNFMDEDCLQALAQSRTVWVPTYVTVTNMIGDGRFDDDVLRRLARRQGEKIRRGFALGVKVALGSDAGAYCVPHAQGVVDEYREFQRLLLDGQNAWETERAEDASEGPDAACGIVLAREELDRRLAAAEQEIRERFVRR